jgi:hypothetical protein
VVPNLPSASACRVASARARAAAVSLWRGGPALAGLLLLPPCLLVVVVVLLLLGLLLLLLLLLCS